MWIHKINGSGPDKPGTMTPGPWTSLGIFEDHQWKNPVQEGLPIKNDGLMKV